VRNLKKQWERERAEKRLKRLVQATWKEFALDPSLGVAGAFGGGRPKMRHHLSGIDQASLGCPSTEKCSALEALLGVALMVSAEVGEVAIIAAALVGGGPAGPALAVAAAEKTVIPWIVVNGLGVYLIFDSGMVADFNRTAWDLR
jgi:hypothetical protein